MKQIKKNIEIILKEINVEIYHIEWDKMFGNKILRIIVDQKKSIDMEKIVEISKYISNYLDENEPTQDNYNLEVMSAGVERELYTQKHWEKSKNHIVYVVLKKAENNIKRLFAKVIDVNDDKIILETNNEDKKIFEIKLSNIKSANWAYKERENVR